MAPAGSLWAVRQAMARLSDLALAAVGDDGAYETYAAEAAQQISLLNSQLRPSPPGEARMDADTVAEHVAELRENDGFTVSVFSPEGELVEPTEGICVALPGTHFNPDAANPLERDFDPDDDGPRKAQIRTFWDRLKPLHDTGQVWLGGYRWPDGTFEINATIVFDPSRRAEALEAGKLWNQETVFDLGVRDTIPTGGDGGVSMFNHRLKDLPDDT